MNEWEGFKGTKWQKNIDVEDFITSNYHEYREDESFLRGISRKTTKLWEKCKKILKKESISGILDVETYRVSGIDSFEPGYIDRHNEVIVGLQTDEPLKRIINPYVGLKMINSTLESHGYSLDKDLERHFKEFRKTHYDGVYDAYTTDIRRANYNKLITGLPDSYGRGKILADYRRCALYGIDFLIERKKEDLLKLENITDISVIQLREDINEQIRSLGYIKKMASRYGFDISRPAITASEAIQWTYFAYLAAVKQNNGSSMSIGRNTTFFDIYIERDIEKGILNEEQAQELIDQFVIKLRLIRHLRTPSYNDFFAGDSNFITESIGGVIDKEHSLVTKTSYRFLNTLNNLGVSNEPNIVVLWSKYLPEEFKKYVSNVSIKTHALQFENDDLMRVLYSDDYAVSSCVSPVRLGYQVQLFGSCINLPKILLYALNGGRDEITGETVIEGIEQLKGEYLQLDEILALFDKVLKKTINIYVDSLNIIHYMHDKYAYESSQMALINTNPEYLMTFGIAGISVVVDSFSAIQYGHVRVKRDDRGITTSFDIEFDYPKYGNNDDRVDTIAVSFAKRVNREIKKHPLYKNAKPMLSLLTLTSNVVYGKHTGATPDGRKQGMPFAPNAAPTGGADKNGALDSLTSVAKIPYKECLDGISSTLSIVPDALGVNDGDRTENLSKILDGYFRSGAHHIDVNVIDKKVLEEAMNNPNKYPNLILGIGGYSVDFNNLSKAQQQEILSRTIHEKI